MIITFVLDTSTSMNQRAANGLSLLDIAKSAIEYFLKIRGRDPQAIRTDRFLLVTFEDGPGGVRVGWKDPFMAFLQEVKNATAKDLTQVGPALKRAFDLINQFRLQTAIDNYGQGRVPWFLEPAAVILLTDGGSFSLPTGITDTVRYPRHSLTYILHFHARWPSPACADITQLTLPSTTTLGQELTAEPFRWDQRLFTIGMLPAARYSSSPPNSVLGNHHGPF